MLPRASLVAQLVKIRLHCGRLGFNPWVAKIPWRWQRLPTPVFRPGEFHGLYSPWGHRVKQDWTTFFLLAVLIWMHIYHHGNLSLSLATKSRLILATLSYSPPGSSVHGILQARKLEWVAIAFSNENILWQYLMKRSYMRVCIVWSNLDKN